MKKEFMFYIRNLRDAKKALTAEEHLAFVRKCELYIEALKSQDQLIAAQPLVREGIIISKAGNEWKEELIDSAGEVQVGYYHIKAKDLAEAIAIAKENPEFEYVASASIEIRPVKVKEEESNYTYPK